MTEATVLIKFPLKMPRVLFTETLRVFRLQFDVCFSHIKYFTAVTFQNISALTNLVLDLFSAKHYERDIK